jgi:hypothetical protein
MNIRETCQKNKKLFFSLIFVIIIVFLLPLVSSFGFGAEELLFAGFLLLAIITFSPPVLVFVCFSFLGWSKRVKLSVHSVIKILFLV